LPFIQFIISGLQTNVYLILVPKETPNNIWKFNFHICVLCAHNPIPEFKVGNMPTSVPPKIPPV